MLLGDCSLRYFIFLQNSVTYKTRSFQDTRCKDISIKSLNCIIAYNYTNFNPVHCTKPSLIILKEAGIFNMRALQIYFHQIPHGFKNLHCAVYSSFPFMFGTVVKIYLSTL